jgi:hypothetical protein
MQITKPGRNVARKNPMRGQIAIEYLATYGWAVLIAVIVISLIYFFLIAPNIIAPESCSFAMGVVCTDIVAVPNTINPANTLITIAFYNAQQFPINGTMSIIYNLNGTNSSSLSSIGLCLPSAALYNPGNSIICEINAPLQTSVGTLIFGTIYITAPYCGLVPNFNFTTQSCLNAPLQTYIGSFDTHVE